jgi:hypothetical protein
MPITSAGNHADSLLDMGTPPSACRLSPGFLENYAGVRLISVSDYLQDFWRNIRLGNLQECWRK